MTEVMSQQAREEEFGALVCRFDELVRSVTLRDRDLPPEDRRAHLQDKVGFAEFSSGVEKVFGTDMPPQTIKSLFRKLSINPECDVDWSEVYGFGETNQQTEIQEAAESDGSIFAVANKYRMGEATGGMQTKRDIVRDIIYVNAMDQYVTVSQNGYIVVYSARMKFVTGIKVAEPGWTLACCYTPNLRKIVACTDRAISVWDPRSSRDPFLVRPLPASLLTIDSVSDYLVDPQGLEDMLLWGDDEGYVNAFPLHNRDLHTKVSKGTDGRKFAESYTLNLEDMSTKLVRRKMHDEWCVKVAYIPELKMFLSASTSSTQSFVSEEINRIHDTRPVQYMSIDRGVNAFAYGIKANFIVTGGSDKVLRVWHPQIYSRPTGKLLGHLFTIVDITINEKDQHIISLSAARIVRVWDIHSLSAIQVFSDSEPRPGERRIYTMMFDNKNDRLLTGSSVVDFWPLMRKVKDTMQTPRTHEYPLVKMIYNAALDQLFTVCAEPIFRVWEAETGRFLLQIKLPFGKAVDVTTAALNTSGYRLALGSVHGFLKVFDFGSGGELKCFEPIEDDVGKPVVDVCWLERENQYVLAIGWGNKIRMFHDRESDASLVFAADLCDVSVGMATRQPSFISASRAASVAQMALTREPSMMSRLSKLPPVMGTPGREAMLLQEHILRTTLLLDGEHYYTSSASGYILRWSLTTQTVTQILNPYEPPPVISRPTSTRCTSRAFSVVSHTSLLELPQDEGKRVNAMMVLRRTRFPTKIAKRPIDEEMGENLGDGELEAANKEPEASESKPESADPDAAVSESGGMEVVEEKPVAGAVGVDGDNAANTTKVEVHSAKSSAKAVEEKSAAVETVNEETGEQEREETVILEPIVLEPILVSIYQDSFIAFWTLDGELLCRVKPESNKMSLSGLASVCADDNCEHLIVADYRGYLTIFKVGRFLETHDLEDVEQVLSWRAHLQKIVELIWLSQNKLLLTASLDGSVRVWRGLIGRFTGYYGQPGVFDLGDGKELNEVILPFDITEQPALPTRLRRPPKKKAQAFQNPLRINSGLWPKEQVADSPRETYIISNHKFFSTLVKPKLYNHHLGVLRVENASVDSGVFRTLPTYSLAEPKRPRTPKLYDDEESSEKRGPAGRKSAKKRSAKRRR